MKCEILEIKGGWEEVKKACRTTIRSYAPLGEISSEWKSGLLFAEHSPIRKLIVSAKFTDIPYWVAMHLVRHKIGIEHFVSTQRSDRTGVDRDDLPQGTLVDYEFEVNAQAIINISRKRLCLLASPETRQAWMMFLSALSNYELEIVRCCMPNCKYRGNVCYEMKSCGRYRRVKI